MIAPSITRSILTLTLSLALGAMIPGPTTLAAQSGPARTFDDPGGTATDRYAIPEAVLNEIRAATERFRDVEVALAEGYIRDPLDMCVTPEMEGMPRQLGGMGIHFFRPDLLGITGVQPRVDGVGTHTDFRQPGVLVYEPQPDGSLELVAIENLVFRAAWEAAGNEGAPEFMGNQYYLMVNNPETPADEAHGFMPHYELHMWLYRDNPNGLFAQFNPNVTCAHHSGEGHHTGH